MVSHDSTTEEKLKERSLLLSGPEEVHSTPQEPQGGQGSLQRGRIWGTVLSRVPWVKCFAVPRLGTDLKLKSGFYLLIK